MNNILKIHLGKAQRQFVFVIILKLAKHVPGNNLFGFQIYGLSSYHNELSKEPLYCVFTCPRIVHFGSLFCDKFVYLNKIDK